MKINQIYFLFLFVLIFSNCKNTSHDDTKKEGQEIVDSSSVNYKFDTILSLSGIQKLGKLYLTNKDSLKSIEEYQISDSLKIKDPGLIYLVINSRSLSKKEEKQNWFDLYDLMGKEQITKLYDILIREKKKIQEIEVKYEKKKEEIKKKYQARFELYEKYHKDRKAVKDVPFTILEKDRDILKKTGYVFNFLGTIQNNDIPALWTYDLDSDTLTSVLGNESIPSSEFIIYKPKLKNERFNFVVEEYIQDLFVFDDNNKLSVTPFISALPSLAMEYSKFGIIYYYDRKMYSELAKFLNITPSFFSHYSETKEVERYKKIYHLYKTGYNDMIKNYDEACLSYANNITKGYYDSSLNTMESIIFTMFNSTKYNSHNCGKCSDDIDNYIINNLKNKCTDSISYKNKLQTQLMLFDFIELFNKNINVQKQAKIIKTKVFNSLDYKDIKNYENSWYHQLTNSYVNDEFPLFETVEGFYKYANNIINDIDKNTDFNNMFFELSAYYLLYNLENNKINIYNLHFFNSIINKANKIGNNPSLDAYSYIEKVIIDLISEKINKNNYTRVDVGKIYSIVIGISDYNSTEFSDLKYAAKDASDFSAYMSATYNEQQLNQSVFIDKDATSLKIKREIQKTLLAKVTNKDIVYVYFSGHGHTTYANENYLLSCDADINDEFSGIEFEWFEKQIRESKAKQIFVFIDACKSGMLGNKTVDNSSQLLLNELEMFETHKIIITSSSNSQNSFEDDELSNGIFTYYLLKGLKGECKNSRNDNFVRISDLREYLIENVFKHKKQTPNITGKIINDDIPVSIRNN